MKLVRPTDFEILDVFRDGRHYTTSVVAHYLDKEPTYVSTRIGKLKSYGLITVLGAVKQCKLYRITVTGLTALAHHHVYTTMYPDEFGRLTRRIASFRNSSGPIYFNDTEIPGLGADEWLPNAIVVTSEQYRTLQDIEAAEPVSLQELNLSGRKLSTKERFVYHLKYHGLVSEHEFRYSLTDLGAETLSLCQQVQREPNAWDPEDGLAVFRTLKERGFITPPDWYEPALFADEIRDPSLPHAYVSDDDD